MKYLKMFFWIVFIALIAIVAVFFLYSEKLNGKKTLTYYREPKSQSFDFQVIDTMKYSRDLSREKLHDSSFDITIDAQMNSIAETGATHVAIDTPYDAEFLPMLSRWAHSARAHGLSVWFRGNWSGWEGWFGYPRMEREAHIAKTEKFITDHPDLFRDGDLFSSCPECENGSSGDPRVTGNVEEYRKFLIEEYGKTRSAFEKIGKNVQSNLFSMNGDVAKLVMDTKTTKALDGIVTVDHYVKTPEQLAADILEIAELSGGKVFLGEFGAPIPDIHGSMTDAEQAKWVAASLDYLRRSGVVEGVNYWLNVGGTTEIWRSNGAERDAVSAIRLRYRPNIIYGSIRDEFDRPLKDVLVRCDLEETISDVDGRFAVHFISQGSKQCSVSTSGYISKNVTAFAGTHIFHIQLVKEQKNSIDRMLLWLVHTYKKYRE